MTFCTKVWPWWIIRAARGRHMGSVELGARRAAPGQTGRHPGRAPHPQTPHYQQHMATQTKYSPQQRAKHQAGVYFREISPGCRQPTGWQPGSRWQPDSIASDSSLYILSPWDWLRIPYQMDILAVNRPALEFFTLEMCATVSEPCLLRACLCCNPHGEKTSVDLRSLHGHSIIEIA